MVKRNAADSSDWTIPCRGDIVPTVPCTRRSICLRFRRIFCYKVANVVPRSSRSRADVHRVGQMNCAREGLAAMGRRLYVGNLPYKCTDEELTELFSRAGAVDNVRVMRDQATGRARGFAFVEMVSDDDAQKAISEFHQFPMEGRALVVNEARPK